MLSYSLETVTAPAAEPVAVPDAKLHCRADWDVEDALFEVWVPAARQLAEAHTRRRFVTQTLRLTLPGWVNPPDGWWPDGLAGVALSGIFPLSIENALRLPVDPVQSVSSVKYYAADGTLTTLDPAAYQTWLAYSPPLVLPAPNYSWPGLEAGRAGAVRVEFVAGYGNAAAAPAQVKAAILLTVAYWYGNRGDGRDPAALGLPPGAVRLLDQLSAGGYS